jgi:hypothetical protein
MTKQSELSAGVCVFCKKRAIPKVLCYRHSDAIHKIQWWCDCGKSWGVEKDDFWEWQARTWKDMDLFERPGGSIK